MDSLAQQIKMIRDACLKAASAGTSCYPDSYLAKKSPLEGHCAAVAYMVQGVFGGEIVTGRVQGVSHYWNRLPDGKEIDLTSCQFGGDGYTPFKKGRKVKRGELVPVRFLIFASKVQKIISEDAKYSHAKIQRTR